MKKIALMFNVLVTFLFSFSAYNFNQEEVKTNLLINETNCNNKYDGVVNITTKNNLISVSGIIILIEDNQIYIATSYKNYKDTYNYEVIFNDYSRYEASVVGIAKEDEILILEVKVTNNNYCSVSLSKSEFIDKGERVDIIGAYKYSQTHAQAYINGVGLCKNCNEETYKNYFYSLLSVDISNDFIGAGVFNKKGQLLGIVTNKVEKYNMGVSMLDVNKLYAITYNLINYQEYRKNYIKYNLLDVNSLTKEEKYLYSLDEGLTNGILVSSIHYLNYIFGGLNQGMVILSVNGVTVDNRYELDNELSKYKDGSYVLVKVRTITNSYKTYRIKL